jgi:ubiquinone/menaquinone biosynthesis C-methylase UbiE
MSTLTPPATTLLDVGCGNGDAAIELATTFALQVTGVDIDPAQISIAVDASPDATEVRFVAADATQLPFADAEFDLVHTNKTTHHVRDWEAALDEMTRVLKPAGQLVYSDFVAPLGAGRPGPVLAAGREGPVRRC